MLSLFGGADETQPEVYTSGGWEYIVPEDRTAEITGYCNEAEMVVIPEELDGKKVAGIGDKAFIYQETIKKHHDTNEEQIDFGIEVTHAKFFSEI